MADLDLETRLDELFATEPSGFVGTRDALVRELNAAGRRDDADAVRALRRPTVAVAAVNQAVRRDPDLVQALLEAGDQLAALQTQSTPDRDELRELTRERRALLHELTELAAGTTARPEGVRPAVAATLDAASLDADLRDDLARGRLVHELSPATRFVADDDTPSLRAAPRRGARVTPAASPPRDELAARRARVELDSVRERAEAADEALREHVEAAADAAGALVSAQRRVAELERALADARSELAAAKRHERDARRAEARVRTEQERVTGALRAAERAVTEAT